MATKKTAAKKAPAKKPAAKKTATRKRPAEKSAADPSAAPGGGEFPRRIYANASPHSVGQVSMFEPGVMATAGDVARYASDPALVERAVNLLGDAGFDVLYYDSYLVNFCGTKRDFERAFSTELFLDERPVIREGAEVMGTHIDSSDTDVPGLIGCQGTRFEDVLEGVAIVIAHNAGFDRPFVEPRFERFASLAWGCSWQEIPWEEAGISSAKLEYLAYRHGFFFEGHRAEIDCLALLEVLRRPFGDTGKTNLKVLLDSARKPSVRLWASNSPFESKELLKARAYRWEPERKTWYRDLPKDEAKTEVAWLKAEIFGGRSVALNMEVFNARTRYAGREGRQETVRA